MAKRSIGYCFTPVAVAVMLAVSPTVALAEDKTVFDEQTLRALGFDPRMAAQFAEAPRFMAGESRVALKVNGSDRGRLTMRFNETGQPCVDGEFIKAAGLKMPSGMMKDASCFDLKMAWQQAEWLLNSNESSVELVLPAEAVSIQSDEHTSWHHGGIAGLVNYDAQYSGSRGAIAGLEFMQLATEAGFNASDWIVRSRQTFTRFNGVDNVNHEAAYAQRTFAGLGKVMQAGQISLGNSMFGAGQVRGVQFLPEQALQKSNDGPGLVEGIADSQSVVEVRQSGVLVYSTTVPAGPFRLRGFPLLNTRSDLEVTLTASEGTQRKFIVPASSLLLNGSVISPGWSFGIGKLEQQGSREAPLLVTAANGWPLLDRVSVNAGVMGSDPWRALAANVNSQLWQRSQLNLQITGAQDKRHNSQGVQANMMFGQPITEKITASLGVSRQTIGYRELSDALSPEKQTNNGRTRDQISVGLGWSQDYLGNFSLSWARSNTFNGDAVNYLRTSWSRAFGRAYVGVSLEKDSGGRYRDSDKRAYLTLSLPLGSNRSISSYISSNEKKTRGGLRYSERLSQDRGFSLSTERDFRTRRTSGTAGIDMATPVSLVSASITSNSDNYTSYSARASGALVAHDGGVTPSAYRVGDTFGVAKVGEEKGVRLSTPSGPAWTDGRGYAVLPSLSSFQRSTIQVDTRSLAKNVDIDNAWNETDAARGSVSSIHFNVVRTRRVLVSVNDQNGKALPYSASVFDQDGNFISVVGENGNVFIPDAENARKMDVQMSGKTLCSFRLSLENAPSGNELYENSKAICRVE